MEAWAESPPLLATGCVNLGVLFPSCGYFHLISVLGFSSAYSIGGLGFPSPLQNGSGIPHNCLSVSGAEGGELW